MDLLDPGYSEILDSNCPGLSMDSVIPYHCGFRIPYYCRIPDSTPLWIPDSSTLDSGFQSPDSRFQHQKFSGFRIPPDSLARVLTIAVMKQPSIFSIQYPRFSYMRLACISCLIALICQKPGIRVMSCPSCIIT